MSGSSLFLVVVIWLPRTASGLHGMGVLSLAAVVPRLCGAPLQGAEAAVRDFQVGRAYCMAP
jgi:hypothetical protein